MNWACMPRYLNRFLLQPLLGYTTGIAALPAAAKAAGNLSKQNVESGLQVRRIDIPDGAWCGRHKANHITAFAHFPR